LLGDRLADIGRWESALVATGIGPQRDPESLHGLAALRLVRSFGRRRLLLGEPVGVADLLPGAGCHQLPGPGDHREDQDEQQSPERDDPEGLAVAEPGQPGKSARKEFQIRWTTQEHARKPTRKNEIVWIRIRARSLRVTDGLPAQATSG